MLAIWASFLPTLPSFVGKRRAFVLFYVGFGRVSLTQQHGGDQEEDGPTS